MSEQAKMTQEEMQSILFSQLIIMLATSAMQQMGKLVNPATGKTETNLEGAQATIDLIDMLRVKTEGNLNEQEQKLIKDTLHSLHMNYLETSQDIPAKESEPPAEKDSVKEEPVIENKKEDAQDSKEPRFHKKYD